MASDIDWTEEAIARLRTLWDEGRSTAEIGRRMGTSKNAVIGKAHRLRLPPRPRPIRAKGSGSTPRPPMPARTRSLGHPPPRPVADNLPPERPPCPPAAPQAPPTRADPPPLATLAKPERPAPARPAMRQPCCWPIGHPGRPGFRFCDADAMPRKPYCAEHAGTAYVAPEATRDRPSEIAPPAQIARRFRWFARDGRSLDRSLRHGLTRTP